MRLNQFQFLVAIKNYGSISAAAQKLYTSQPTISNAIRELEEELDCRILERSNKGVAFTRKGKEILTLAEVIVNSIEDIQRITRTDDTLDRELHVGAPAHLCNLMMYPIMVDSKINYPNLDIHIEKADSLSLLEAVDRRELNLAVLQPINIPADRLEKAWKTGVVFEELFQDQLVIAGRTDHPLLLQDEITAEEVAQYPFASFYSELEGEVQEMRRLNQNAKPVIHISDIITLRKYLCNSDTLTSMSLSSLINGNNVFPEQLAPLPIRGQTWKITVGLVHKGNEMTRAENMFAQRIMSRSRAISASLPRIRNK